MASGVRFNHIPQTIDRLRSARSQIVRKSAFDVERYAKQGAPVDTGALKNSIYTVTEDSSGFGRARPDVAPGASLFPEVHRPPEGHALVVVGVSYGIFQELGTIHMAAHPYMYPAAVRARPEFLAAFNRLEEM